MGRIKSYFRRSCDLLNYERKKKLVRYCYPFLCCFGKLDMGSSDRRGTCNILHTIAEAGAAFKSLADAWADTRTPYARLMLKNVSPI
jgi:hypothetical protein